MDRRLWVAALLVTAGGSGCVAPTARPEPVYFPPPPASPHVVHLISFNALGDVVPARRSWTELFRGFAPTPHVQTPAGIAFCDGALLICDIGSNVVHRWPLDGERASRIGAGELAKPVDVAVDAAGRVYVADTGLAATVVFDADGRPVKRFAPPNRPHHRPVAVAPAATTLLVADIGTHQVDAYSIQSGEHLESFGGAGDGPGRFFFPMDVSVRPDGALLVADMMNSRVQLLDAQHQPLTVFGRPGNRYGDMGKPRRLAVGPDGVLFVADVDFAHVHLLDEQGSLLMLLGGPEATPGHTPMPVGLAVARELPAHLTELVPGDFCAQYFLFAANTIGDKRLSLYAVGAACDIASGP